MTCPGMHDLSGRSCSCGRSQCAQVAAHRLAGDAQRVGADRTVDLVSEHSTLPSDQTLWTSVHDISCILSSAATHATRAEQLRRQLAGCSGLIFLATARDPPNSAASWFQHLVHAAPLGAPQRYSSLCSSFIVPLGLQVGLRLHRALRDSQSWLGLR